jgi:hypothetical protein
MHRLPNQSTIIRFRLASLLLVLKYVGPPVLIYFMVSSLIKDDPKELIVAASIGLALFLAVPLRWIIAERTRCPLCLTPVLGNKGCSKHRHAKTFLGSYRLRVALAVIFKKSFRCPYCNEPSILKVRIRHR